MAELLPGLGAERKSDRSGVSGSEFAASSLALAQGLLREVQSSKLRGSSKIKAETLSPAGAPLQVGPLGFGHFRF
jgi:hypothetical protein